MGEEVEYNGRFTRECSIRRAGHCGITFIDGDDQGSFLCGDSLDLLYWWAMIDQLDLLSFFMRKLSDELSSSSNKTPVAISRKNKEGTGTTVAMNKKQKQEADP